jgi:multidrug efflux pump subunit AcrB
VAYWVGSSASSKQKDDTIQFDVDQDRARALGISSQQLSNNINAVLSGTTITQLRDSTYLIDIVARAVPEDRCRVPFSRRFTSL